MENLSLIHRQAPPREPDGEYMRLVKPYIVILLNHNENALRRGVRCEV